MTDNKTTELINDACWLAKEVNKRLTQEEKDAWSTFLHTHPTTAFIILDTHERFTRLKRRKLFSRAPELFVCCNLFAMTLGVCAPVFGWIPAMACGLITAIVADSAFFNLESWFIEKRTNTIFPPVEERNDRNSSSGR